MLHLLLFQAPTVDSVLERWANATNLKELLQVETITTEARVTEGPLVYEIKIYKKRPGKFRQEVTTEGQKLVQILNEKGAWGLDFAGRKRRLSDAITSQLKSLAPIDPLLATIPRSLFKLKVEESHWLLEANYDNRSYTFWIDKVSHHLTKYAEEDSTEGITITQEVLSYELCEGVYTATQIRQRITRGLKSRERIYKVIRLQYNEPIDDSLF